MRIFFVIYALLGIAIVLLLVAFSGTSFAQEAEREPVFRKNIAFDNIARSSFSVDEKVAPSKSKQTAETKIRQSKKGAHLRKAKSRKSDKSDEQVKFTESRSRLRTAKEWIPVMPPTPMPTSSPALVPQF